MTQKDNQIVELGQVQGHQANLDCGFQHTCKNGVKSLSLTKKARSKHST